MENKNILAQQTFKEQNTKPHQSFTCSYKQIIEALDELQNT